MAPRYTYTHFESSIRFSIVLIPNMTYFENKIFTTQKGYKKMLFFVCVWTQKPIFETQGSKWRKMPLLKYSYLSFANPKIPDSMLSFKYSITKPWKYSPLSQNCTFLCLRRILCTNMEEFFFALFLVTYNSLSQLLLRLCVWLRTVNIHYVHTVD